MRYLQETQVDAVFKWTSADWIIQMKYLVLLASLCSCQLGLVKLSAGEIVYMGMLCSNSDGPKELVVWSNTITVVCSNGVEISVARGTIPK